MAQISGEFSKSINSGYQQVIVKWTATTNEETNKSTVVVDTYFKTVGSVSIGSRTNSTTIDGVSTSWNSSSLSGSAKTWKIGSVTKEVAHDNVTGEKTISISSVFNIAATISGTYYSNITASKSGIVLPTIPRASNFTVSTGTKIGGTATFTISRASTSFSTLLKYRAHGESGWGSWTPIATVTGDSYSWIVPLTLNDMIPTTDHIDCEFQADTISNNVTIGTTSATATFYANSYPTVSTATATDVRSLTAQLTSGSNTSTTKMVKSASNIQISATATAYNNSNSGTATITAMTVNGNTMTLTGSGATKTGTYTINNATTNTFQLKITDSRGLVKTINVGDSSITTTNTLELKNYTVLSLNALAKRHTPTDGIVNITFNGNYWNSSFGNTSNTLTAYYRCKQYGASSWTPDWTPISASNITKNNNNTYSGTQNLSGLDYRNIYVVEVKVRDEIYTGDEKASTNNIVPKGEPVYWWKDSKFYVNGDFQANSYVSKDGRLASANLSHQYPDDKISKKTIISSGSMTTGKPSGDGFIDTYFWDNSGLWDTQFFLSNGDGVRPAVRARGNTENWTNAWRELAWRSDVPTNTNQLTNGAGFISNDAQECGTSGIWKYIKFKNGYAICIGNKTIGTKIETTWGNLFHSGDKTLDNFPFTFVEVPWVVYSTTSSSSTNSCFVMNGNGAPSASNPGHIMLVRGSKNTSSVNYSVTIQAIGKWKN